MTTIKNLPNLADINDLATLTKDLVHIAELMQDLHTPEALHIENKLTQGVAFDIRKAGILALLDGIEAHIEAIK